MKTLEGLSISRAPWFSNILGEIRCQYYASWPAQKRERVVATTNRHYDEHLADARFIAASPKLYKAAYNLVSAFDRREMTPEHVEALRAVLAEAAGEEVAE